MDLIISFEGIHSVGKSTQIDLIERWLIDKGVAFITSRSNSSYLLGEVITELKTNNLVDARSMIMLEAADLSRRWTDVLSRAIQDGKWVICDRYVDTIRARAMIRQVDRDLVDHLLSFAPVPDVSVLIECGGAETLTRRKRMGLRVDGSMCGEDIAPVYVPELAFVEFQDRTEQLYKQIMSPNRLEVCCTDNPLAIHDMVTQKILASTEHIG